MGLLDDAIREHLELKRRRGADATEVARQEQEAFGPLRRGDAEAASTATAEPALDEPGTFAAEDHTALHVVPPPEPEAPHEAPPVQEEESRFHGDPADDLPHLEPRHTEPAQPHPEPAPVPEERPVQEEESRFHGDPADDLPDIEQATEAFDADEIRAATTPPPAAPAPPAPEPAPAPAPAPARAAEPEPEPEPEPAAPPPPRADDQEGEPEDVLEETPEFLQETPEHDRLWFEQRPPRDFDF